MKKVTCSIIVLLSVFIYGFVMADSGKNPPSKTVPVTVVNPASNPVPVSGTVTGDVSIKGTAGVNVVNTNPIPVQGNVGISGTANVNVVNTIPVSGNIEITNKITEIIFQTVYIADNWYFLSDPIDVSMCQNVRVNAIGKNMICGINHSVYIFDSNFPDRAGHLSTCNITAGSDDFCTVEVPMPHTLITLYIPHLHSSEEVHVVVYCR